MPEGRGSRPALREFSWKPSGGSQVYYTGKISVTMAFWAVDEVAKIWSPSDHIAKGSVKRRMPSEEVRNLTFPWTLNTNLFLKQNLPWSIGYKLILSLYWDSYVHSFSSLGPVTFLFPDFCTCLALFCYMTVSLSIIKEALRYWSVELGRTQKGPDQPCLFCRDVFHVCVVDLLFIFFLFF